AILFIFGLGGGEQPQAETVTIEQIISAAIAFHEQRQETPEIVDPETGELNTAGKIDPDPDAPKVRGIYMTGPSAGVSRFDRLIELVNSTDLNAVVLDIKEDHGYMTYEPIDPELKAMGNYQKSIRDIHKVMDTFKEHDIYPI